MAGMEGLGRLFDISAAVIPQDLSAGPVTGKRLSMRNASAVSVVVFKGKASGGTDPALTITSHDLATGGNTDSTTVVVDHYYKKSAASYAGTTTWTKVLITATATPTISSEQGNEGIYVFEIRAGQLPDGYPYLEVDAQDAGTSAQIGGILYIPHDLQHGGRIPAQLQSQLT